MTAFLLVAAGDQPNSKSGGKAAGHNTDGFDVSSDNLIIEDRCVFPLPTRSPIFIVFWFPYISVVMNQDDCIAINKGSNIIFENNSCTGGHGVSIGSIKTGGVVSNVQIL